MGPRLLRSLCCCISNKSGRKKQACNLSKYSVKVAVLGSTKVGKSCLLQRLIKEEFEDNYYPTEQDCYEMSLKFDDVDISLNIIDTGGAKELKTSQRQAIRESDAFILVFSLTSKSTFEHLIELRKQVARCNNNVHPDERVDYSPVVVVGNKQDLRGEREVSLDQIKRVVENQWDCPYVEVSAKNQTNLFSVLSRLRDEFELSGLARVKLLDESRAATIQNPHIRT